MDTKRSAGADLSKISEDPNEDRRPLVVGLDPDLQAWYRSGRNASAVNRLVEHWLQGEQKELPRVRVPREFISRNVQMRLKPDTVERLRVVCREKSIAPSSVVRGLIALRAVGEQKVLEAIANGSRRKTKTPAVALCIVLAPGTEEDLKARLGDLSLGVVTRLLVEGWVRAGGPPVRFVPHGNSKAEGVKTAGVKIPSGLAEEARRLAEAHGQTFTSVMRALVHSFAEAGKVKDSLVDLMAEALRASAKSWDGPAKEARAVFDGMTFEAARLAGTEKMTAEKYQARLRKWTRRPTKIPWDRGAVFATDSIAVRLDARTLDGLLAHLRKARTNSRSIGELMSAIARNE